MHTYSGLQLMPPRWRGISGEEFRRRASGGDPDDPGAG